MSTRGENAIERGVGEVIFSDARAERPVSRALAGEGTVIRSATMSSAPTQI